jgi:exodeoxyribonuclease (lambda-induced)
MTATNPQDRDAWIAKRRGKITASRIGDIARRKKDGSMYAAGETYLYEVLTERLTGQATEHYVSAPMQWGLDQEANAVAQYEFEQGVTCAFSDFVDHPTIPMSGASPDRLVGDDGLLEVKCPISRNHIQFLLDGDIAGLGENYPWQMQWQMASTGRKWCDFVCFDPRITNAALRMRRVRVERDEEMIKQAEAAVIDANRWIAEAMKKLVASHD